MIEKWDAFPLLYLKDVLILLRQFHIVIVYAPVAQGIEHRPPEAGAAVRIRPGVYFFCYFCWKFIGIIENIGDMK